jgi:predicted nuclease of restriction endonuclease-like (RecB) superfamily
VSTLSTQLSWSHFIELLPLKNTEVKLFYANKIAEANWGVMELRKQKASKLFERTLVANNQLPSKIEETKNIFKDPYLLDFLNLRTSEQKPRTLSTLYPTESQSDKISNLCR